MKHHYCPTFVFPSLNTQRFAAKGLLFLLLLVLTASRSLATIVVTPGSGGTNICARLAVGGAAPAFTTLGTITVAERANNDFGGGGTGFNTITLTAPTGWQFNTASTPTLTGILASHFTNLIGTSFTATNYTILVRMTATAAIDSFTITGLQVQATSTSAGAGNIVPTAITGTFTGIVTNTTNFGSLSLTPVLTPAVSISQNPAGAICAGTSVTFTANPVNGGTPTYQWILNSSPVVGATNATYVNSTLANGNTISVNMTATGCVTSTSASSPTTSMTVNALPAAVTVTGTGTYCDNQVLVASNGGSGTIYYQNMVYNGTSTTLASTTVTVNTLGAYTYYFRARSAAGCWGTQGSVAVTLNPTPASLTATAITPSTICEGDSVTFAGSATPGNVVLLGQDFNTGLGSWSITNLSGVANSYWQIRNAPGYNNVTPGDGSALLEAAPDAAGSTIVTNTILTSPSFSLVDYSAATLTFNQYYLAYFQDTVVAVEYSIDGGGSWNSIMDQTGITAGATTWTQLTPQITLAMPVAALGQPSVMLRWNYRSLFGWYWAIDNISVTGVPVLSYSWAGIGAATGLSCTSCDTVNITPTVSGVNDYNITTSAGGCTAVTMFSVTVNPVPAAITGSLSGCLGNTTTLSDATAGGDWTSSDPAVATIGSTLGDVTSVSLGTSTISYTLPSTGCFTTAEFTVNPVPVVSPISGPTSVCEGSTITLTDDTTGGTWNSSNVAVATIDPSMGEVTGIFAGTATMFYTVTNIYACSTTVSVDVTVNPLPTVAAITGATSVCVGSVITLADATAGGVWNSADVTTAMVGAGGEVTGIATGATTISYTVTDMLGCSNTATQAMTVVPGIPTVTILPVSASFTLCNGNPVNLVSTTSGSGLNYQWTESGTPISGETNTNYVATVPGTYGLTVDNGVCQVVLPTKNVVAPPVASIAYNTTANFLYTGSFAAYQWLKNGVTVSGATSSILVAPTAGDYRVVVRDNNGCSDTSDVYTITVPSSSVGGVGNASGVRIYPVPVSSVLNIDAASPVNLRIVSPDGKLLLEANATNAINVSALANGIYLVLISDTDGNLLQTERFSKIN